MLFLCVSLDWCKRQKGRKDQEKGYCNIFSGGIIFYFASQRCFYVLLSANLIAALYMAITLLGYLLILTGAVLLSRLIKLNLNQDIFNKDNETFPQEERFLENEYSINLPAVYSLKGKRRKSWINIINPFRGILVAGTPGAGKSYFVIRHIVSSISGRGFTMFLYDFKYDDLTKIAYNMLLKYKKNYKALPKFYVINFDDLSRTHRCNP